MRNITDLFADLEYFFSMRGGGHTNYIQDPVKRAQWAKELAERKEITPEQLVGFFSPEWIHATDAYQRRLGATSMAQLIASPTESVTEEKTKFAIFAENNIKIYDDIVEDQIDEDELMNQLLNLREEYTGDEAYSRLVRTRRTIVAYIIHTAIEDHSAA